ncbi:MAG: glycosyltransferase family 4 protein [Bacteroidales bacterium]
MRKIRVLYITANGGLWGDNKALLQFLENIDNVEPYVVVGNKGLFINELKKLSIPHAIVKNYFSVWPSLHSFRDIVLFLPRLLRMIFINKLAYFKVKKIVKCFKPDLIHTNTGPVHIGHQLALQFKIKHVWYLHEFQILDFNMYPFPSFSSFTRKLQNYNNYVIANSKAVYRYFGSLPNARIIYSAMLSKKQKEPIITAKEKYFLFVGRISVTKGIKEVVETFGRFSRFNNEFKLKIVGSGSLVLEKHMKDYVNSVGLNDRVEFLGFRNENDIKRLMQHAYATIMASRNEALGLVTIEAMANGCLVIGRGTAGTAEILQNGKYGLIYHTSEDLLNLMIEITTTSFDKYLPFIIQAQDYVFETFAIEKSINSLYKLYEEIVYF